MEQVRLMTDTHRVSHKKVCPYCGSSSINYIEHSKSYECTECNSTFT